MLKSTIKNTKCKFCGHRTTKQALPIHLKSCKKNPTVIDNLSNQKVVCENCDLIISRLEAYSGRFCSKSCARSFSTKNIKGTTKLATCIDCGVSTEIPKQASSKTARCKSCKTLRRRYRQRSDDRRDQDFETFVKNPPLIGKKEYSCQYCQRKIFSTTSGSLINHEKSCKDNPASDSSYRVYHKKDYREGYIYIIKNVFNGKIYIGKKSGSPKDSLNYYGSGIAIKSAIKKYGKSNFTKEILESVTYGDLNAREKFWIKEYSSNNPKVGYNLTEGGDGGPLFKGKTHKQSSIEKMIATTKRNKLKYLL